jgi:hypothetical protein
MKKEASDEKKDVSATWGVVDAILNGQKGVDIGQLRLDAFPSELKGGSKLEVHVITHFKR